MSGFFICDYNYLDPAEVISIDYSSENSSYAASNLENFGRRGKVWRSAGYFKVDATNDKIIFRDDAITDKTATIASGEYTSLSAFLSAVDAALEAVGAANYTVTQDGSTGKIKLLSDLSGGATAFQLILTNINFTAYNLLGFDNSADLTDAAFYLGDYLSIHSSEFIELDLGTITLVQAVILVGRNREAIKISPSAVIKIQGNMTSNWDTPAYEETLSYHNEAIYLASENGLAGASYRYWRIYIEDKQNLNYYIELSKIFIGECFFSERGCPQFGLSNEFNDSSTTVYSESGTSLSEINNKTEVISFEFSFMTKGDMERLRLIFEEFGTAKPFFIIFDNNEVLSTEKEMWAKLVKFTKNISVEAVSPNNFTCEISVREEI
jgi:hypothetical protein